MRRVAGLAFIAAAILASGCHRKDPIAHYKAPKEPTWRMMAAIVPTAERTWFFKAIGPGPALLERKDDFNHFIGSVTFADGNPHWSLPKGWTEEKGTGERQATLRFGRDGALELSVSSFPGPAGGILANVNRWRGQLGLSAIGEADLPRETVARDVGGNPSTVVDFEGPRRPQAAPFAHGRSTPSDEGSSAREPFSYDLPKGWTRTPQGGRIEFQAGGARVTITGMDGEAGGLAANVNRWRGQVGLEALDEPGAQKAVQPFALFGREGLYLELMTSEKSILCVFTLDKAFSIFVKMDGPAPAVEKQKQAFQDFAASLKIKKHG